MSEVRGSVLRTQGRVLSTGLVLRDSHSHFDRMGDSSESSTAPRDSSNFPVPTVEDDSSSYVTLDEIDTPSAPRTNNQASNTPPVAAVKAPIRDEDIKPKNFPPRAPSTSPVVVKSSPVVEKGKQSVEAPVAVQRKVRTLEK
jgi:hypothetical protein